MVNGWSKHKIIIDSSKRLLLALEILAINRQMKTLTVFTLKWRLWLYLLWNEEFDCIYSELKNLTVFTLKWRLDCIYSEMKTLTVFYSEMKTDCIYSEMKTLTVFTLKWRIWLYLLWNEDLDCIYSEMKNLTVFTLKWRIWLEMKTLIVFTLKWRLWLYVLWNEEFDCIYSDVFIKSRITLNKSSWLLALLSIQTKKISLTALHEVIEFFSSELLQGKTCYKDLFEGRVSPQAQVWLSLSFRRTSLNPLPATEFTVSLIAVTYLWYE